MLPIFTGLYLKVKYSGLDVKISSSKSGDFAIVSWNPGLKTLRLKLGISKLHV